MLSQVANFLFRFFFFFFNYVWHTRVHTHTHTVCMFGCTISRALTNGNRKNSIFSVTTLPFCNFFFSGGPTNWPTVLSPRPTPRSPWKNVPNKHRNVCVCLCPLRSLWNSFWDNNCVPKNLFLGNLTWLRRKIFEPKFLLTSGPVRSRKRMSNPRRWGRMWQVKTTLLG